VSVSSTSSDTGLFSVTGLPAGNYKIVVEKQGFKTASQSTGNTSILAIARIPNINPNICKTECSALQLSSSKCANTDATCLCNAIKQDLPGTVMPSTQPHIPCCMPSSSPVSPLFASVAERRVEGTVSCGANARAQLLSTQW
jgi:hypothetical protein